MELLFNPFKNKWLKATLLIVLLQQMLVAAGTFFLGELSSQFPTEGFNTQIAILLFLCIFLPGTIVHYWVIWFTVKASKLAQLNYLNQYVASNYNNPTHWREENSKHMKHDIMCRGGQDVINSSIYFYIDLAATGLNIILNTVSIIFVTDLVMGVIIIAAGLLGISIIHIYQKKISESSRKEMLADNALNSHLSRSWDNIILGNGLYFERWKNHFNEVFLDSEEASLQTVKVKDRAVSFAAMVTNGVVLGGALGLAWMYQNSTGFVLAILVMLPRSLQIVMHIQIIQGYIAKWKNIREKLSVAKESLFESKPLDLSSFIKEGDIKARIGNNTYSLGEIEKFLDTNQNGRITITGPNGVGKSSLFLNWKKKFNTAAIYLPAHHQLMVRQSQLGLSSGELALAALKDVQSAEARILLLDEWDANLSSENRAIFDSLIEGLSREKLVVEIRHSN